jgi:hypothetical protein
MVREGQVTTNYGGRGDGGAEACRVGRWCWWYLAKSLLGGVQDRDNWFGCILIETRENGIGSVCRVHKLLVLILKMFFSILKLLL